MADKLFAGGGTGGGFLNMALPIGLGVAAAAHPALARGAHVISASMQNAQRNRRLREAQEMQEKYYGLAEKRAAHEEERAGWAREDRPGEKARKGIISTGSDPYTGTYIMRVDPNAPGGVSRQNIAPPSELTESGQQVLGQRQTLQQQNMEKQGQITRQNQAYANQLPPSQTSLLGGRQSIEQMKVSLAAKFLAQEGIETPTEADILRAKRQADLLIRPYEDAYNNLMGAGAIQTPVTEAPPEGWLSTGDGIYSDPNNPANKWIAPWKLNQIKKQLQSTGNQ